jgi:asparagine synthase (glutamine-hydrolysing)
LRWAFNRARWSTFFRRFLVAAWLELWCEQEANSLLFNGEAIFGVVDFTGQPQAARWQAERLTGRAAELSAHSGYSMFGATALGWINRKIDLGQSRPLSHDIKTPIVVAGELVSLARSQCESSMPCRQYDWLVDGYQAGGNEFLTHLDGTFALALWQEREQKLILMTDRCGDGKLFFQKDADRLLFSSWLKLLGRPHHEIDRQSVHEFLRFLYITPPRTIYRGIHRIEPGNFLSVSLGTMETAALEPMSANPAELLRVGDTDESLKEFQTLFEASIRRRIGTRRVGVFLSSGVDSATLLAGCERVNPGRVEAFTVGFDTVALDESNAARAFAHCLHLPHSTLRFKFSDYRWAFENMSREFDQPFADPACLPLACAANAARQRVDVISDGSGSDGLFGAAIPRHLQFSLSVSAKVPKLARKSLTAFINWAGFLNLRSYATLFDFDDPEELFVTWSGWRKRDLEELLGSPVCLDHSGFYRAFRARKYANSQQRFDAVGVFPPDDARFEAAAMANIPIELPYHDVEIASLIRRLPQGLRFQDGVTKILLRQLFAKYYSEYNEILKKRYFTFPLHSFIAEQDYALVRRFLSAECLERHALVEPCRVARWIDRYLAGDQSLLFKIWSLLVMHGWLESRN